MRTPKRDNRPYTILFISATGAGDTATDKSAWSDPDQALAYGQDIASRFFRNTQVEIVVVHTGTREAVRSTLVEV